MTMRRTLAILGVLLLLFPSRIALAQDPSTEGVEQTPAVGVPGSELGVLLPTELAGDEIGDEIRTLTGPELRDESSHDGLQRMEAILDETGKTWADVVNAQYYGWPGDGGAALLGAVRISGSDIFAVVEAFQEWSSEGFAEPRVEHSQIAGKDVILIIDDADPEQWVRYVYASGDTIWVVSADDPAVVEEALAKFP